MSRYLWRRSCESCISSLYTELTDFLRIPTPILTLVAWIPVEVRSMPHNRGCSFSRPASWAYLPFVLQAVFDLFVFVLCTFKVSLGTVWRSAEMLMIYPKIIVRSDISLRHVGRKAPGAGTKLRLELLNGGVCSP
jgi:hypothetical protein